MNHIDITFDLETTATTANAAVMQIAAVAWNRNADEDPFCVDSDTEDPFCVGSGSVAADLTFNRHIDLRTCVVDGFDFDQQTVDWWSRQSDAAKHAVTDDLPEPIEEVFIDFIHWIEDCKKSLGAESVCLWCQGMDFDAAILRNICRKYDLQLPLKHQQFRDCRTFIIEVAVILSTRLSAGKETVASLAAKKESHASRSGAGDGSVIADLLSIAPADSGNITPDAILANDRRAYDLYTHLPAAYADGHEAHDALYDCLRSSWNVWQALKLLKK